MPHTYGQILADLETMEPFISVNGRLKLLAPLRNLMAHEYLDLRFDRVKWFVDQGALAVQDLSQAARMWLGPAAGDDESEGTEPTRP